MDPLGMKQIETSDMIHYDFPIFGMAWNEHIGHMDSISKWLKEEWYSRETIWNKQLLGGFKRTPLKNMSE